MQQAQIGETWNELFQRAYTPVFSKRREAQRPQIEGKRYRQVFGGKLTPPIATVAVTHINGQKIKIRAGVMTGVTVGSTYRLYRSKKQSYIKITKVGTFESEGKITTGTFKVGDLVLEENHIYDFKPIKIYLSADYPKKDQFLLQAIRSIFKNGNKLPAYVLTGKPDKAELNIRLLRPKREINGHIYYEKKHDALPKSDKNQLPELWVLTPDQHLLQKQRVKINDV